MAENENTGFTPPVPYPEPPNTTPVINQFSKPILSNLAAWAAFKAVIDIITGALACLGIITAIYGIPQIMSGVKLMRATENIKKLIAMNDISEAQDALYNLNRYFKLSGIAIIIQICFVIITIIIYAIFIAFIISNLPDIFHNFPGNNDYFTF
jgi:hypothetical protein